MMQNADDAIVVVVIVDDDDDDDHICDDAYNDKSPFKT